MQLETEPKVSSTNVTKRRRATKEPAAATTAAATTICRHLLNLREEEPSAPAPSVGATHESFPEMNGRSAASRLPYVNFTSLDSELFSLMAEVVDDISMGYDEKWPVQGRRKMGVGAGGVMSGVWGIGDHAATKGRMGSTEHVEHGRQQQRLLHHQQQAQLILQQQQERQHSHHQQHHRFDRGVGGGCGDLDAGFDADGSSCYEDIVQPVTGSSMETDDTVNFGRVPRIKDLLQDPILTMQQAMLVGEHSDSATNHQTSPIVSVHNCAQRATDAFSGAGTGSFHLSPAEVRNPDDLPDMLTLWIKLEGFSPGDLPMEGLAPELHHWMKEKVPASMSGHIQPGCTLFTVDCLLTLGDTSKIRMDGIHALAEAILTGPLVRISGNLTSVTMVN